MPELELPAPAFFFSDAHLGFDTQEAERTKRDRLLRFLDMVRGSGASLVCLGDLFDFWFEYESAIPALHFALLRRLQELGEGGVRLYFMGGNHDWWVRRGAHPGFLEREIGFTLLEDGTEVRTAGLRLVLFHGDGLGSHDIGYRLLKALLRNRLAIKAFRWVHPDLARRLGWLTATLSRVRSGGQPSPEACARVREFARGILLARPDVDAVVVGHTHRAEDTPFGRGRYVNLGDWIRSCTYAVAENGSLTLQRFEPSGGYASPGLTTSTSCSDSPRKTCPTFRN